MARFSPQRLYLIRRLRQARGLWKRFPLLAFEMMKEKHDGYTYNQFLEDLRPRKRTIKNRYVKSSLRRYGRFSQMEELIGQYKVTGNPAFYLQAQKLRMNMTKPYSAQIRIDGEILQWHFDALIPYKSVQKFMFTIAPGCKTKQDLDAAIDLFRKQHQCGG